MSESTGSRLAQAREAARRLVDMLETEDVPIEKCLMLGQRLARLLRDEDASRWLALELRGYPSDTNLNDLGTCAKYALRRLEDGKTYQPSLPAIEAEAKAAEMVLNKLQSPAVNEPVANFTESRATQSVINSMNASVLAQKTIVVFWKSNFARQKSMLHQYASDTLIALELGDVAEDIFETARTDVDMFVRANCPKAAEQLLAASERLRERNTESLSEALGSCRRVLNSVADAVFAPRDDYEDAAGRTRKVGADQYVNRLLAFIEEHTLSGSTRAILDAEVRHLSARLDAVYEKACKGVHAEIDEREARLALIQTYLLIAEVARYHPDTPHPVDEAARSTLALSEVPPELATT